jgi:uncharacterized membrane protein
MDRQEVRRFHLKRDARSRLWLIPLACLIGGIALAIGAVAIDRAGDYKLVSQGITGTATDVQQILNTTASALISLMSIVLSLTLVAVQLAMGQFSPRIVRALFEDRRNQWAIGVLVGAFVYTVTVLVAIDDQNNRVPGVATLGAYVLTLVALGGLFLFVQHAARSLRVTGIIDLVGDHVHGELQRFEPLDDHPFPADPSVVLAPDSGNVNLLHQAALVELAAEEDCAFELIPAMGDFVPRDSPLVRISGEFPAGRRDELLDCIVIESERTHEDDPSYGLRKLVDIAQRSVASSPFDDPTTAVQALHRIHDSMRVLATRRLPDGHCHDRAGTLRFSYPTLDWPGYVRLAFDEMRLVGAGSPQVARKLRSMLIDLKDVAPSDREAPLDRQLELLDAAVRREYEDDEDMAAARVADDLGIGAGEDVLMHVNGREQPAVRE